MLSRAVFQYREVHLGNGRTGDGLAVKRDKNIVNLAVEGALDAGNGHLTAKRRHPVLQTGEFVGNVNRQQVAPGGQHLAKFHKNGPQALQRLPNALTAWRFQVASDRNHARNHTQPGLLKTVQEQLVQPVAEHHPNDKNTSNQARHVGDRPGTLAATVPRNWRSA